MLDFSASVDNNVLTRVIKNNKFNDFFKLHQQGKKTSVKMVRHRQEGSLDELCRNAKDIPIGRRINGEKRQKSSLEATTV